jgi:hypothetical protein
VWPEDLPHDNGQAVQDAEPKATNVFAIQPSGIEVDSQGLPWDNRIHSGSRAKVSDGTWRQKRNLDPNLLAEVEGELRQTMGLPYSAVAAVPAIPVAPVTPESAFIAAVAPPPPAAAVPVPPPFVPSVEAFAAPVATTPPIVSAGAAPIASPSSAPVTFPQLMQKITQAFTSKTLDQPTIQAACQSVGLSSLPMLASRPDLVAQVATALGIAL